MLLSTYQLSPLRLFNFTYLRNEKVVIVILNLIITFDKKQLWDTLNIAS